MVINFTESSQHNSEQLERKRKLADERNNRMKKRIRRDLINEALQQPSIQPVELPTIRDASVQTELQQGKFWLM